MSMAEKKYAGRLRGKRGREAVRKGCGCCVAVGGMNERGTLPY